MVPVVDLSRRGARFATEFAIAAERIARSGRLLLQDELASFETEFAAATGFENAVGVSSGASALQLALTAAGIGPGDDVLVPGFTAVPTASAVLAAGAVPVLVDVDPSTACVTPPMIEAARTPRTRAAIVVHLYGFPTELPPPGDLVVIEDAAQASGSALPDGGSAARAYSFYPTKNLGGIGDGGAVVTDDSELAATVRRLRAHGMTEQYVHVDIAQNHRMSELEAAWLRIGLPYLDADVATRRRIAARYREAAPQLRWQQAHDDHAYHLCVFRSADRERDRRLLADAGVGTSVHYPLALTQQPAYAALFTVPCPESEAWAAECVSVPCFPEMTEGEIDLVASSLARLPEAAVAPAAH